MCFKTKNLFIFFTRLNSSAFVNEQQITIYYSQERHPQPRRHRDEYSNRHFVFTRPARIRASPPSTDDSSALETTTAKTKQQNNKIRIAVRSPGTLFNVLRKKELYIYIYLIAVLDEYSRLPIQSQKTPSQQEPEQEQHPHHRDDETNKLTGTLLFTRPHE